MAAESGAVEDCDELGWLLYLKQDPKMLKLAGRRDGLGGQAVGWNNDDLWSESQLLDPYGLASASTAANTEWLAPSGVLTPFMDNDI